MDKMLDHRVAIVNGAGRGIGAAITCRLATGGASTIVNHRSNPDGANEIVETIEKAGGTAKAVKADVGHPDAVVALFGEREQAFRPVDLLVDNAAMRGNSTPAHEIDVHRYDEIFSADVCGPLLMMAEFAKRNSGGGAIVNMSSDQSRRRQTASRMAFLTTSGSARSSTPHSHVSANPTTSTMRLHFFCQTMPGG